MTIPSLTLAPYGHFFYRCPCGEAVMLSVFGADVKTCRCGRRHSWDAEQLSVVRSEGEREHG